SAKGDDKFITTDYLQQCPLNTDDTCRNYTAQIHLLCFRIAYKPHFYRYSATNQVWIHFSRKPDLRGGERAYNMIIKQLI
ncbi:hypothetical protein, partial [Escherichia coli]|uniref:hypothetical protein n=1 Tax=Escherichia coli TaxID=562 RepID=UPI001F355346